MTPAYLKACVDVLVETARVYADATEGRSEADPLLAGSRLRHAAKEMRRAELAVTSGVPQRRYARELPGSEIPAAKPARLRPKP